jgi:hypothetical protein
MVIERKASSSSESHHCDSADYSLPLAGSRHDAYIDAATACLHMHLHVVRERFSNHPCFPLH